MRTIAGLLLTALLLTACGKKGALVYPDMLVPSAPTGLSAEQSGDSLKISFILPSRNLAGRGFAGLSEVIVSRRDEPAGTASVCPSCLEDFTLFRRLNPEALPAGVQRSGDRLVLLDGDTQPGRTYTYRVTTRARDGAEGALSAPVSATLLPALPSPPKVQVLSQPTEIQVELIGVSPGEGDVLGYNVYRAPKGESFPLLPLNREPLTGKSFTDAGMERRVTYSYGVRTVVRAPSGGRAESALSPVVEGQLKDDE